MTRIIPTITSKLLPDSIKYRILFVFRAGAPGEHLKESLSSASYEIIRVHDGEQALRRLQSDVFQAIVYEHSPQRIPLEQLLDMTRGLIPKPIQIVIVDKIKVENLAGLLRAGVDDLIGADAGSDLLQKSLERLLRSQPVDIENQKTPVTSPLERLVGRSAAMAEIKRRLSQLAHAHSTVLFTGESGTGKTLAAEVLHALSARADQPYLRVYCPALSRTLVESELFGHDKGAFTDAKTARPGIFERAHGGTVLLEEVGDLPLPTQSSILRFLETGEVRRIGSNQVIRPDVRILVATAEPLQDLVSRGGIRKNLLYRLEGVRVDLPPLRSRKEDIPDLVRYILPSLCASANRPVPRLTREALERLSEFDWPGNVRQLQHTLEGMIATLNSNVIDIADIPLLLRAQSSPPKLLQIPLGSTLADAEKALITETLRMTGGNKNRAARILGVGLRTLYRKIKLYRI